jgi:Amt family ammonium transporter
MESFWTVLLASAALLVRIGQMIGAMGIVRAKNSASAGFRNLSDLFIATLCFWAIGSAIFFQYYNGWLGIQPDFVIGWHGLSANWFAMLALILIATGIIAPAVAERSTFSVPLCVGGLLAAILVPLIAHWTWSGWLNAMHFLDTAGAAAIHLAPATCATVAIFFVGPREGKYNRDGSSNMIPGHSVPMLLLALLLSLIGWVPYVLTAAAMRGIEIRADLVAADIFIATSAAGIAGLLISKMRYGKVDVMLVVTGALGGMVSVTASAGVIGTPAAFLIGLIAGIIVPWMTVFLDLRLKFDDPAGVIAIHGVGGIWALLAAALFAPIPFEDRFKLLGTQAIGIVVTIAAAAVLTFALMVFLKATIGVRTKEQNEFDGLDLAEHDINSHPDFQQTTIKSYHLREA